MNKEEKSCPKCGWGGITVLFKKKTFFKNEHLKCKCSSCEYSWVEGCLDKGVRNGW